MSIVIKTKLKKMPESCTKCKYSFFINYHRVCSAAPYKDNFKDCERKYALVKRNYVYERPTWCPLTETFENSKISTKLEEDDIVYAYSSSMKAIVAYRIEDAQIDSDVSMRYFAIQNDKSETPDYIHFTTEDINQFVFKTEKECQQARKEFEKIADIVNDVFLSTVLYNEQGDLLTKNITKAFIKKGIHL